VKREELERLGNELQQLREKLSDSKEKRKRLVDRLRAINPIYRGGRSRGSGKGKQGNALEEERGRSLKPELICWKEGATWIIGVELPEELESQGIFQDGIQLECDRAYGNRYPLKKMVGKFEIISRERREDTALIKPDRDYLIFKFIRLFSG
jgi:hypothetical protein